MEESKAQRILPETPPEMHAGATAETHRIPSAVREKGIAVALGDDDRCEEDSDTADNATLSDNDTEEDRKGM